MAKYLITGVAGFIAARVAEFLLRDNHSVFGVDNLDDAYDVRMKDYRLRRLQEQPGFAFKKMDIADRVGVERIFSDWESIDAVINLAARAGVRASLENPWVYTQTNVTGTLNLLEACRQQGIKKFILASSSSVYGADAPLPTPEDADTNRPLSPYAASKKSAEVLCHTYHYLYDLDVTVFRYFTVFGPAGRPNMAMFRFAQWIFEEREVEIYGDGNQTRGFTYVDDIAIGTILGLTPVGYEIINLGGHETVRIIDLVHQFEEMIGKKAQVVFHPRHPADVLDNWADVNKAGKILGWEPQVSLSAGVSKTIDWYREERSWASQVSTE